MMAASAGLGGMVPYRWMICQGYGENKNKGDRKYEDEMQ